MATRIDEIQVPHSLNDNFSGETPFNSLRGIKRLNVLIGPNNSGKSRLLRALFQCKQELQISTSDQIQLQLRTKIREFLEMLPRLSSDAPQHKGILDDITDALGGVTFPFTPLRQYGLSQRINQEETSTLQNLSNDIRNNSQIRYDEQLKQKFANVQSELRGILSLVGTLGQSTQNQYRDANTPPPTPYFQSAQFVYVPTLRGMRIPFDRDESKYTYFDRTINDYFGNEIKSNSGQTLELLRSTMSGDSIVTGLDVYDMVSDRLLGSLSDRRFIREFENFLSRSFFGGRPLALIPRKGSDTLHIKVGDEVERPVQELGDGIQQIIILTLPIFLHREVPTFLFIEEPDLFLHPGFQQVLIDLILQHKNEDLYVFVTTHSSQFVDVTLDENRTSIFKCEKCLDSGEKTEHGEVTANFRVKNVSHGDTSILRHIGVRPSSVMFANCTIWVEGITDRLYLQRYLELILQLRGVDFVENLHYSFVEYGGGNITHWSFLDEEGIDVDRLCGRLFLVADQDTGKEGRHQKLRESLGERFYCLPAKEIENLLSPAVISKVIRSYEHDDNFVLNNFQQSAYKTRYLGKFIDSKVYPDKTKSKRYGKLKTCFEDQSGTVKSKLEFCRRAIKTIESCDCLSDEAIVLANKICNFIVEQNKAG